MNKRVLQKVIDELNRDNPKLDYMRGVLETLVEGLPEEKPISLTPPGTMSPLLVNKEEIIKNKDEGTLMDMEAKAKIDKFMGTIKESVTNA